MADLGPRAALPEASSSPHFAPISSPTVAPDVQHMAATYAPSINAGTLAAQRYSQAISGVHSIAAITSPAQTAAIANAINAHFILSPTDISGAIAAGHAARTGIA